MVVVKGGVIEKVRKRGCSMSAMRTKLTLLQADFFTGKVDSLYYQA
jgi:hypothetical protein